MKVLVVNAGSSSLKYQLIDMETEKCVAKGNVERIGEENSIHGHKNELNNEKIERKYSSIPNHTEALQKVLDILTDAECGVIKDISDIGAVGHRVLHGAEDYKSSVLITDEVLMICEKNKPLGPLHMPANLACIYSCRKVMPNVPMVAVFDTSFHQTMPAKAFMYAIPYELYKDNRVRRYGFHGTSHKYVTGEVIRYMGKKDIKIINCHLGNGASVSAVKNGEVMDTSMGLTPLEGLVMGTRSGDIDPALMSVIAQKLSEKKLTEGVDPAVSVDEVINYLNKKSGLLGISGYSDSRDLEAAASGTPSEKQHRAMLALEMFAYRVKKYIGSYTAVLNGVDCIVFTGGIGENSKTARTRILADLEYLGIKLDNEKNQKCSGSVCDISADDSKVKILVIPTNEELVIARDTVECVENSK